jgi:hypothetical protein
MLLAGRTQSKFRRFAGVLSVPDAAAVQSTCARIGRNTAAALIPKERREKIAQSKSFVFSLAMQIRDSSADYLEIKKICDLNMKVS